MEDVMRYARLLSIVAVFFLMSLGMVHAGDEAEMSQKACPSGCQHIEKSVYRDHDGKRIYFCGEGCAAKFDKDPESYIKTLESQGVALEDAPQHQSVCPVSGEKINREFYSDYQGKRVYFGCAGCRATFEKDPESYIQKLQAQGIALESVPNVQTQCPVMGGKINKEFYRDYKGERVYFCCGGCPEEFDKNPMKFIKKLKDQGVQLEAVQTSRGPCQMKDGKPDCKGCPHAKGRKS
jgi:YHS domain-containing protein